MSIFAVIACFAQLIVVCDSPAHHSMRPRGLIVLEGALNAKFGKGRNLTVDYDLNEKFPATETIAQLTKILKEDGWVPVEPDSKYSYSGPGRPTPDEIGWHTYFENETRVLSWVRTWRNPQGQEAIYNLTYRTRDQNPLNDPSEPMVHVFGYLGDRSSVGKHG